MPGPPPKDHHAGHRAKQPRDLATYRDSTAASGPVTKGQTRRAGIAIPQADPAWLPITRSWFNSLLLSGQSDFYEASDYATAVVAAKSYDIFLRTYNASVLAQFVRLSERLGVTIADRKRAHIELVDPDVTDADEEAADATVLSWQEKFDARNNSEE